MALDGRLLSGVSVPAAIVETGNFARAGEALGAYAFRNKPGGGSA